jgi:hypothetical protein
MTKPLEENIVTWARMAIEIDFLTLNTQQIKMSSG